MSATVAADLMRRITAAGSRLMSPFDIGDLITGMNLPVTFIEHSLENQVGWSIGTPNGPPVAFVNTGSHYQIWLPEGSDLAQRFEALAHHLTLRLAQEQMDHAAQIAGDERVARELSEQMTPARPWSTTAKGETRLNAVRRSAENKGIARATAGARKRQPTAGDCNVKAVSTTKPAPVRQPGVSQWWGRGGEPAVTNPTPTKTFAQATSSDRSLALQIAAEDRAIADSIDADARMARELSDQLNGL